MKCQGFMRWTTLFIATAALVAVFGCGSEQEPGSDTARFPVPTEIVPAVLTPAPTSTPMPEPSPEPSPVPTAGGIRPIPNIGGHVVGRSLSHLDIRRVQESKTSGPGLHPPIGERSFRHVIRPSRRQQRRGAGVLPRLLLRRLPEPARRAEKGTQQVHRP